MTTNSPMRTINDFRERAPVDVVGLIQALGLRFNRAPLHPKISGMIEKWSDTYLITVNQSDPLTRRRFTAAHELGHWVLHRDLIGDGVDDDRLYRSIGVGKYHNTAFGSRQETEANKFAANLLMPMSLIEHIASRDSIPTDTAQGATSLAKIFDVSPQAMSIRLGVPQDN